MKKIDVEATLAAYREMVAKGATMPGLIKATYTPEGIDLQVAWMRWSMAGETNQTDVDELLSAAGHIAGMAMGNMISGIFDEDVTKDEKSQAALDMTQVFLTAFSQVVYRIAVLKHGDASTTIARVDVGDA